MFTEYYRGAVNVMRTLIAGPAGFLGSQSCEALLRQGHVVMGFDNFQTGRLENINHLLGNSHLSFIEYDADD